MLVDYRLALFAAFVVDEFDAQGPDEPFYVVDISRILAQHQVWLQNMPHVQQFYAVECNNYKLLLTVLAALGCNFDCASKGEIEADRIIYVNPCKTASYIKHATARQVRMMRFDNEQELYKIMKLCPDAELVLRLTVCFCPRTSSNRLNVVWCPKAKTIVRRMNRRSALSVEAVSMPVRIRKSTNFREFRAIF